MENPPINTIEITQDFKDFRLELSIDKNRGQVFLKLIDPCRRKVLALVEIEPYELENIENLFNMATMQILDFIPKG